ncbi:MAG: cysteine desulfurase, partial [Lentisphaeria bacterium]|nr:cysteine desulfurase [Lentisphaeria bacterium]
ETVPGNPSSIYTSGRLAKYELTRARDELAEVLGVPGNELIFTSGGTESDNLAIKGLALANQHKGRHIITSQVEHKAVLDSCQRLQEWGFEVTYLPTDKWGLVDPETLQFALRPDTILVSLIWVNNELGSINSITELGKMVQEHGALFHTDAVQALGKLPIVCRDLPVDAMSVSGHKIYGPKGVGALWLRKGTALQPLIEGGSQESNLRGGTENLPGIVGFSTAAQLIEQERETRVADEQVLMTELSHALDDIPGIRLNTHPELRAPNILNISIPHVDGESLFINLDLAGVAVSNGSACTSGAQQPSGVLTAIGVPDDLARATIRISIGRDTTRETLERFTDILKQEVYKLQKKSKAIA